MAVPDSWVPVISEFWNLSIFQNSKEITEMKNKLTLTEQEELFVKDCKLINLKYEYNGYTGDEK